MSRDSEITANRLLAEAAKQCRAPLPDWRPYAGPSGTEILAWALVFVVVLTLVATL